MHLVPVIDLILYFLPVISLNKKKGDDDFLNDFVITLATF